MASPLALVVCTVLTAPPSALQSSSNTRPATSVCLTPPRTGRRTSTSRVVPKFCTCDSPRFSASTAVRTFCRSAGCW